MFLELSERQFSSFFIILLNVHINSKPQDVLNGNFQKMLTTIIKQDFKNASETKKHLNAKYSNRTENIF